MEPKGKLRTAAYCRLSRDDGDKPESESIANQRYIIEDYCKRDPELEIVFEYADDGYTGTNFDRPGFRRMIADIEAGRVDCVVVKDLSRFGRDYIDMGFYLERFFPEKGVRFIAVNEGVDSRQGPYDILLPLRNVFNAQYAKDASEKVKKAFRAKQKRGESVRAFAPYGYRKDPGDKNRFLIDPEAAGIVRRIFEEYARGESFGGIARALNREGIASPIEYKRRHNIHLHVGQVLERCYWSSNSVGRILKDEVYLGNMVSNRYPSDGMHGKTRRADRSEWIIVEGTHAPIVSREQWEAVRARFEKKKSQARSDRKKSLFSGMIRCGECGGAMVRRGGKNASYHCAAYRSWGRMACGPHGVSEKALTEIILGDLRQIAAQIPDAAADAKAERPGEDGRLLTTDGKRVEAALDRLRHAQQSAYEDYRAGVLTRSEFIRCKAEYEAREKELERQEKQGENSPRIGEAPRIKGLIKRKRLTELDRKTLEQTVKTIRVFKDNRVEITYLFSERASGMIGGAPS